MNLELLMTLAVIHTVALASPGPDLALVLKLASQESRQVAVASAAGIALAILVHTMLSLTGVSLVIKSSQTLFFAVQLLGAGYLAWMGFGAITCALQHWRDKCTAAEAAPIKNQLTVKQGFMQGLYTNLLNPKAMIFFITLFSAMITPEVSTSTKAAASLMFLLLSLSWFVFIALVLSKPNVQQKMQKATPVINLITGLLFVSVALVIAGELF
ncbi:LysE family transporter [Psychromonas aquimarina]|uniref:LysE family transporter n=1 Tax=Psychromonas aquimarina TaxID=444919 RepID=UPI0004142674|nr:LysE family transporter [Psychromonas aquimarina]